MGSPPPRSRQYHRAPDQDVRRGPPPGSCTHPGPGPRYRFVHRVAPVGALERHSETRGKLMDSSSREASTSLGYGTSLRDMGRREWASEARPAANWALVSTGEVRGPPRQASARQFQVPDGWRRFQDNARLPVFAGCDRVLHPGLVEIERSGPSSCWSDSSVALIAFRSLETASMRRSTCAVSVGTRASSMRS